MLPSLLAMLSLVVPQESPAAAPPAAVPAVVVRGPAELSPALAQQAALREAEQAVRRGWQQRAEQRSAELRPRWLPEFLVHQGVRRWVANLPTDELLHVVAAEQRERTHEFGSSWQSTLWIGERADLWPRHDGELRLLVQQLAQRSWRRLLLVVGGWFLLALLVSWLDRLSRGYMTARLCCVAALFGCLFPFCLFLV